MSGSWKKIEGKKIYNVPVWDTKKEEGIKDCEGKSKVSLVPYAALQTIAKIREYGNLKYKDSSKWYTGKKETPLPHEDQVIIEFVEANIRHSYKWLDAVRLKNRSQYDEESGLHHLEHAACTSAMAAALLDKKRKGSYEK